MRSRLNYVNIVILLYLIFLSLLIISKKPKEIYFLGDNGIGEIITFEDINQGDISKIEDDVRSQSPGNNPTHLLQDRKDKFIEFMIEAVAEEKIIYPDLPMEIVVAQSILESAYGCSSLARKANNLFGHKYRGINKSYMVANDDTPKDKFEVYDSHWFSLRHHNRLLMRKYRPRIEGNPTTEKWLKALCGGLNAKESKKWVETKHSVYATSCMNEKSCYVDKLKNIIQKYDLKKRCNIAYKKVKSESYEKMD